MPFADRTLRLDGRRVGYVDAGPRDGPVCVLLHGGAFDHAELSWRLTLPHLARRMRVIAPDLPGYGESEGIGSPHGIDELGAWTLRLLDALGLARVDMAGVSMGGGIALWLAIHHPDRVGRLVPVSSYGIMERAPFHPLARIFAASRARGLVYRAASGSRALARFGLGLHYARPSRITERVVDELMAVARDQLERQSFDAFLAGELLRGGLAGSLVGRLHQIAAPTLFIHGTHDRLVPVRHARAAARLVPGAELALLETGHWPMRELPGPFNEIIWEFLGAGRGPSSHDP
ncbi:alpha/beta hydrolase [Profundibacterium mesophilum]|uniref:Alphabeta hydrolase fold protein n=1 Tax=Profundibacterium mesophilum KAUST100406-0324 TaxID=1037889 RepID=A0A921TCT1_9RHOB|nr:alpha/beta fold hydrolase [Profundibacterium mesophilum]KAF0677490.1 Alphabeta hydrolase fold protein [Profundibacterium mesophilum KAUST100406-0324]